MQLRELSAPKAPQQVVSTPAPSEEFQDRLLRWHSSPTVITAGEVIGTAIVEGHEGQATSAAKAILGSGFAATPLLRSLARRTLHRAGQQTPLATRSGFNQAQSKALWRRRTRLYPYNSLAWVELALYELLDRNKLQARRCMTVALQLAPHDRHVLRSAARLFVHLDEADRAHELLVRNDRTLLDPWLLAAGVSIATLAQRRPPSIKSARYLMESDNHPDRHLSELAGALATLDLEAGSTKRARAYFRRSVVDPTGNALAQMEWAAPELGRSLVAARTFAKTAEREEARVFTLLRAEQFQRVPLLCDRWSALEPYAIRPYEFSSSATTVTGKHKKTIATAAAGLQIRSNSTTLLNNMAFALAHCGDLDGAERYLNLVTPESGRIQYLTNANRGLLALRKGFFETGLDQYREAILGFSRIGDKRSADVARLYRAREAAIANVPGMRQLVDIGREANKRLGSLAHSHVADEMERAVDISEGQ